MIKNFKITIEKNFRENTKIYLESKSCVDRSHCISIGIGTHIPRATGGSGWVRPRVRNETVLVENRSFPEDNGDSGLHRSPAHRVHPPV